MDFGMTVCTQEIEAFRLQGDGPERGLAIARPPVLIFLAATVMKVERVLATVIAATLALAAETLDQLLPSSLV